MRRKVIYNNIVAIIFALIFFNISCNSISNLKENKTENVNKKKANIDLVEIIYSIADKKGMKVISDINMGGGGLFGNISADKMVDSMKIFINRYNARYGKHNSFYGW